MPKAYWRELTDDAMVQASRTRDPEPGDGTPEGGENS